jgi:trans-2,3-dihydro-3-hydroxyanthranilate isomerase
MSDDCRVELVRVFSAGAGGGNPAPIIVDAAGLSASEMQDIAARFGHESGFVLPPVDPSHDFRFRFFVPNHEMEMCGHASVGALWLLRRKGRWTRPDATIETKSGIVRAIVSDAGDRGETIEISQPAGRVEPIHEAGSIGLLLDVMNIGSADLMPLDIVNATTSRTKTLIPLRSVDVLNGLKPDFARVGSLCDRLGSTGLYPFTSDPDASLVYEARQFPRSSGYPEDPATGIAATALLYGLRYFGLAPAPGDTVRVRQGVAMGRPSEITIRFAHPADDLSIGCWLGGSVEYVGAAQ